MPDEIRETTVTFSRPVQIGTSGRILPAGTYRLEWRPRAPDGAGKGSAPDGAGAPRSPDSEVNLHIGMGRGAEVLTLPWEALSAAIANDRLPGERARKQPVAQLLEDPLIRLVMASDGVSDHALRRALRAARMRRAGRAALAGRVGGAPAHFGRDHGPAGRGAPVSAPF